MMMTMIIILCKNTVA